VLDPAVEAWRVEMKELLEIFVSLQKDKKTVGLELPADEPPMCTVESSMTAVSKAGDKKI
jgi:hypothetical protein